MCLWIRLLALSCLTFLLPAAHALDNGVLAKEILIGQFAAQTGPAEELGKRMQQGILAYFKAVNATGGIHGRQLKLISRDDGYEPERAVEAVKILINQDRVFALIGSVGTPTTLAAVPLINEEKIPLIGPFSGAQALREPFNKNIFHVRASYFDETERIVQHLTTFGVQRIAVFHQNDSYGKAGLEGLQRALAKRGMKPAAIATVERNSVDVAAAFAELVKVSPEAIVQVSAYKSCAALIKLARKAGYGGQFFNVSFVGAQALANELGDLGSGVSISQVVPFPYIPSSAVVRDYRKRMQDAGYKEFDFSSMEGYLAARVLVEGLKRAGLQPSRASLVSALESMSQLYLDGFMLRYSASSHEGSRYTDLTTIGRDGHFIR